MAEKKNFTIKNYTGTDYDTLYPQTTSEQVLLDSTAQASTNLPSGSTLDDALQSITKDGGTYQIGDTLTTTRTNLGDKWLLCNGQAISITEYPELAGMLKSVYDFDWESMGSTPYEISELATDDDTFLIVSGIKLFVTNTLTGDSSSWTRLYSVDVGSSFKAKRLNNNFIGLSSSGSSHYWTSNNITTETALQINGLSNGGDDIIYYDNHYFSFHNVTGSTLEYCNMYIWDDLANEPNIVKISSWYESSSSNISVGGSFWDLPDGVGLYRSNNISKNSVTVIITNSSGDITSKAVQFPEQSDTPRDIFAIYWGGKYYLFIKVRSFDDYDVYISDSLTSGYTMLLYGGTSVTCSSASKINNILVLGGSYYIDTEGTVHVAKNKITTSTPVVIGTNNFYTTNDTTAYSTSAQSVLNLPSVSQSDGLYTYIKAKN